MGLLFIISILFPERPLPPQVIMGSHISIRNTPFAVFYQPALIPKKFSVSFSYSKPYEGLSISQFESAFSFPLFIFSGSIGFSYFGEEIYKEQIINYGMCYKNSLYSAGIVLKYLYLNIPEVVNHAEPSFDAGCVFFLPFNIRIGAFSRNIYRSPKYKYDIPSLFAISFAVIHEALNFYFDLISEENHPFTYATGFEIPLTSNFYIKGGLRSGEKTFGAGFGINVSFVKLEGFYRVHPFLGSSFSVSVVLKSHEKKSENTISPP